MYLIYRWDITMYMYPTMALKRIKRQMSYIYSRTFFLQIWIKLKDRPPLFKKLEILWAMLTKWYPLLPHVLYGKVLVLLWETP